MNIKSIVVSLAAVGFAAATGCTKGSQASSGSETPDASTATAAPVVTPVSVSTAGSGPTIKVYKDANCGCCKAWVEHLEQNGFKVEPMDMPDLSAVKQKYGVKPEFEACHTGVVDGYAVEGHVPADVILKMLKDKPTIAGIAVPGMPSGSPGMEGGTKEKYDVLTFDRAGRTTVYATR